MTSPDPADPLEERLGRALAQQADAPVDVTRLVRGARAGARVQRRRRTASAAAAAALAVVAGAGAAVLAPDLLDRGRPGTQVASDGGTADAQPLDDDVLLTGAELGPAHDEGDRLVQRGEDPPLAPPAECPPLLGTTPASALELTSDAAEEDVWQVVTTWPGNGAEAALAALRGCVALQVEEELSSGEGDRVVAGATSYQEGVQPAGHAGVAAFRSGDVLVVVGVRRDEGDAVRRASDLLDAAVARGYETGLLG